MHLGNTAQIYQNIYYGGLRIIRAYPKSSRRLPIEKAAHKGRLFNWSGQWDSDPRHQPWQGCALPLSYTRII